MGKSTIPIKWRCSICKSCRWILMLKHAINLLQGVIKVMIFLIGFSSTCTAWPKLTNDLWAITCFEVLQSFRTRWKSLFPTNKIFCSNLNYYRSDVTVLTLRLQIWTPANVGFKTRKKGSLVTLKCCAESLVTFLLGNDVLKMEEVACSIENVD